MKRIFVIACCAILLISCHENLEDRAAREAKEYTEKFCPTPVNNFTRTDSVVFEKDTKTYHYYCTLTGLMDNLDIITMHQKEIHDALAKSIKKAPTMGTTKNALGASPNLSTTDLIFAMALGVAPKPNPQKPAVITAES